MSAEAVLASDWALFQDWCSARDLSALPAAPETLDQFLRAVPGRPSTDQRRLLAIRREHQAARETPPIEMPARANTIRAGDRWVSVPRALAQLPTLRFPIGLRGRRDGWILVLVGVLGFSRSAAVGIKESDILLHPELRVAGQAVPRASSATECPACAVFRWLRVVGPAIAGVRSEVRETLNPQGVDDSIHDCSFGLDGFWRTARVLTPSIDRHGWVRGEALSLESMSTIMRSRQMIAGEPPRGFTRKSDMGRFKDATSAELAAAYDEVDAKLADLLAKFELAVSEGSEVLHRIEGHYLTE